MNSTALGAGAENAQKINFISEAHEKFYYEKLELVRHKDVYHKALVYCLGINSDTRRNVDTIYDFERGYVKTECLQEGWQTSGSVKVVRMAFNLYCNGTPSVNDDSEAEEQAENQPNRSELERFDNLAEALEKFNTYSEKYREVDDKTRTTLGFNVQGSEFDVFYARNNENILSLDYTHSSKALQNNRFIDELQILCNELVDKVRVYRDMTPEEEKSFVKERFKYKLESGGLDDIDMYMTRFDTLYEQGKMEDLMPSANQKRIVEDIPLEKWDTSYFALHEVGQMAFAFKDKYVSIQICDEGYDYSIYHTDYSLFDGGIYDNSDITIYAALYDILEGMGVKRRELVPVNYDELLEKAEAMEMITELIDKIPDMEVRGSWEKWQASLKKEQRITERFSIKEKLLEKKAIIDQKSKGDKLAQERDTEKAKGNVR